MKRVLLLLARGFEPFEACAFIDVIGWNLVDGDGSTELKSCGLEKEVESSFDQKFIVDFLIGDVEVTDFDALAIPGGFEEYGFYKDAYDEKFLNIIREFYNQKKIIASICTGALPLGKSGVLKNKKGTTYNKTTKRQEALRNFGVEIINEPIVIDDNVITSCGPSTAVDVALRLLAMLTSRSNSDHIREIMGFKVE
jgi:4-methyl-5(b-hydroxyethyl)-thiazole monophosphate biosynthesis